MPPVLSNCFASTIILLQAVTPAPWSLHGDAFLLPTFKVGVIEQYDTNPLLGAKLWSLAGAVTLVRYYDTSVGPYSELIFSSGLYKLGRHIGFHISQIYVDSEVSLEGGRTNWAVPKKLAKFDWQTQDSHIQVNVSLPDAAQPFFTASLKQSQFGIPASSVVVPPPLKTILQACDSNHLQSTYLSTRVDAAGKLHLVSSVSVKTDGREVPSHTDLGVWRAGVSLSDFRGIFAKPQSVSVGTAHHKTL